MEKKKNHINLKERSNILVISSFYSNRTLDFVLIKVKLKSKETGRKRIKNNLNVEK